MRLFSTLSLFALFVCFIACDQQQVEESSKPNVVLVIVDDQGYGDIAAHGNPYIRTPYLDQFHSESVRLTDFHVSPTCSPSRAALMTGRYTNRTGAWHTIAGWSLLRAEEKTLANMFAENGYSTGAFGKWHLGDNYPYRVQDRGFQESVVHGGGGVQQTPDYWGNDYFDDTYFHNGEPKKYEGYCTDVFFKEAMDFIDSKKEEPFFCYISTNAPHWPYNVPPKYEDLYDKYGDDVLELRQRQFLGMITNIDENFGKLRSKLAELEIADNTILIFMADNGTAAGYSYLKEEDKYLGFNAGMRGTKNSQYEGGHRVPFYIHWKDGNISGGRDLTELTAHIDVMPSLAELCGIKLPNNHRSLDGQSLVPLINNEEVDWAERVLVTDSQREQVPARWRKTAVMKNKWRLVNENELYNISEDPSQENNVAETNPALVTELQSAYDKWWESVSSQFDEEMYIAVGSSEEPMTTLTTHDWHAPNSNQKWNQLAIRNGGFGNGYWTIDVAQAGEYEVSLRRYPIESGLKFSDSPAGYTYEDEPGLNSEVPEGKSIAFTTAKVRVGDEMSDEVAIDMNSEQVNVNVNLKKGKTRLWSYLSDESGNETGAYYAYVKRLE